MSQKRYGEIAKQYGYQVEYFKTQTEAFLALRNNTFTQVNWNEK